MSNGEANKMIRVLTNERLKYTVHVYKPDGKVVEWQSAETPHVKYFDEARALWLYSGQYGSQAIMAWEDGMILLVEENPK